MKNYKVFIKTNDSDIEVAEFDTIKECKDYILEMTKVDADIFGLFDLHDFYIYGKLD